MVDVSFYKNKEKRTLKPDLFSTTAESLAKEFSADERINKRSQVRKFYDEVVRLNSLAKTNPESWDDILPYVNMLIAKATYAEGRKLVTGDFVKFIQNAISQVQTQKDLDVFANLFEAFMGFYRKHCRAN
jgi:CRISPR-associated protein Csm2